MNDLTSTREAASDSGGSGSSATQPVTASQAADWSTLARRLGPAGPLALAAAAPATYRPDPRYLQADQWMDRRQLRLQVRYSF